MPRRTRVRSPGETRDETSEVRAAANDNTLARIGRDVRRTAFGWRHAQAVSTFVAGREEILASYDDLRERSRAEGDTVALGAAFHETLTRHAVLLKQAEAFRARPAELTSLLAERGGIGRKDLDAFEELHARARRHRRAATMRHVHRIKREAGQEAQQPKPELRQGELALEGARAEVTRHADTARRDTAGMQSSGRDATPGRYVDSVPPGRSRRLPLGTCRGGRAGGCAAAQARPGPSQARLVCALRSLAEGLERTDRKGPTNRGAAILRQGIRRHDPPHPGIDGEPGYPGRDTSADDRGA